jgi:hypothetical protein
MGFQSFYYFTYALIWESSNNSEMFFLKMGCFQSKFKSWIAAAQFSILHQWMEFEAFQNYFFIKSD